MLVAQSKIKRIDEARKELDGELPDPEEGENEHEEGVKIVGKAEAAMHDVHEIEDKASDHLEDQKRVFDKVLEHPNHQH